MSKNKQTIFVIRGDLLFTDYQIDSVHTSYKPTHPNSIKSGYVAEHRLVAEEKRGLQVATPIEGEM